MFSPPPPSEAVAATLSHPQQQIHHSLAELSIDAVTANSPPSSSGHQPQPSHSQEKRLPPVPQSPTRTDNNSSNDNVVKQHLAPLQLDSHQSFADELGSYLTEQDILMPPEPSLKETLALTSSSIMTTTNASSSLRALSPPLTTATAVAVPSSASTAPSQIQYQLSDTPTMTTTSTTSSSPTSIPPTSESAPIVATIITTTTITTETLASESTVANQPVSLSPSSSNSTIASGGYPMPEQDAASGLLQQGSPVFHQQSSDLHPQQLPPPPQRNSLPQQQVPYIPPSTYVTHSTYIPQSNYVPQSTYVPQSSYVHQSTYTPQSSYKPQTIHQSQPQPLQQQQQPYSLPEQAKSNSFPALSPSVGEQSSPPTLVPSLGVPSSALQSGVNNAVTTSPFPSASLSRAPSPYGFPSENVVSQPTRLSSSSDEARNQQQSHMSAGPQPALGGVGSGGKVSPLMLNNATNHNEFLKPIPTKSEDWALLVDAPASPRLSYAAGMMHPYQNYHPGQPFQGVSGPLNSGGYSDSPAEETTASADYMQHLTLQQQQQPLLPYQQSPYGQQQPGPRPQAYTDPTGQNHFGLHHQNNSSSTVPGNMGSNDLALGPNGHMVFQNQNRQNRRSWSPNTIEPLESAPMNGQNSYGYHTPPRRINNASPGPRSGSHSKQNSVATSVSLLTDAAVVAKYRDAAIKTNDTTLQLSYAKYLLEIGELSSTFSAESGPPGSSSSTDASAASGAAATNGTSPAQSPVPGQDGADAMGKKQLTLEAIYWMDRLAKEGQPEAQYIRGTWYEDGLYGTKKSADKALRWYQSASKGDFASAHYKVAYFCEKRKDNNKAVVLYKKAATHNDVPANHRLAIVYLYGELGQSKNMKTGLQYLKRAASFATENSPMSPYVLGLILAREYKQLSIPDDIAFPDDGEALEWFKKAAELGYGPANYKMGYCYEYGTLGCTIDPFLSVRHYERAVSMGDGNGEAEMALSGWYLSGAEGCFEANDGLAFQYASQAADRLLPKAQYALGYYYEVGISVPIDMTKAMECYRLAAANGNKDAQARLSDQSTFHKSGHKNSIRRIKQGRNAKDQSCVVM